MNGDSWQLAAVADRAEQHPGRLLAGQLLRDPVDISTEDERDRVSSRGWAFGYLGGGLLLLINLVVVLGHDAVGLEHGAGRPDLAAVRRASGGPAFTIIPFVRLRNRPPMQRRAETGGLLQRSFGQLFTTLRELRNYPMTLTFLVAYLFYNDGIQTVIYAASTYGSKQLEFGDSVLIATILLIQFVAFGGALLFGRLAARHGAYRLILWGTFAWMVIVVVGDVPARREIALFLARRGRDRHRARRHPGAVAVVLQPAHPPRPRGRVLRALQRLRARHVVVRVLLFGVVFQVTGSYRPAIVCADHLLRARRDLPAPARPRARHRGGRQRGAGHSSTSRPDDAPGRLLRSS